MRILHAVEFYPPSVGGVQAVVRQLSERLAARGHDVTVATGAHPDRTEKVIGGVNVAEFDVGGNEVRGMQGDVEGYRRFVTEGDFDVVMTYAAQQWTTDALLPVLDEIRAHTVLAPCGFSGLRDPAYAQYFAHLRDDLKRFDELIFHSDTYQDSRFARDAGAERLTVIPNAADEREFGELRPRGSFRAAHKLGPGEPLGHLAHHGLRAPHGRRVELDGVEDAHARCWPAGAATTPRAGAAPTPTRPRGCRAGAPRRPRTGARDRAARPRGAPRP